MRSNELIKGKWYSCKQWSDEGLVVKFDKIVNNKLFYSESIYDKAYSSKKGFTFCYYHYDLYEVGTPLEDIKPTPKRKRYEKKKVEELLDKLSNDIYKHLNAPHFFSFEQWKQDNL